MQWRHEQELAIVASHEQDQAMKQQPQPNRLECFYPWIWPKISSNHLHSCWWLRWGSHQIWQLLRNVTPPRPVKKGRIESESDSVTQTKGEGLKAKVTSWYRHNLWKREKLKCGICTLAQPTQKGENKKWISDAVSISGEERGKTRHIWSHGTITWELRIALSASLRPKPGRSMSPCIALTLELTFSPW